MQLKKVLISVVVVATVLAGVVFLSLKNHAIQNLLLDRIADVFIQRGARILPESDSLRVFVCGSASPLGVSGQAQACIAVLTPDHFYIIDSGVGSTANLQSGLLPMNRLQGVFLTHFHSDHIAEIYEVNLNSWVNGRPVPLTVYGPAGVETVTSSVNDGYALDRKYRTGHHGAALLPPELGLLTSKTVRPGVIFESGDLKVTMYTGGHPPVAPAVGYRFDYRGRSLVVSGDSLVTDETRKIVDNADLLLHDALSFPIVSTMSQAAGEAGFNRISKIMSDVLDYHASASSLIELGERVDIGMVAFYHLVPSVDNIVVTRIFERDMPSNYLLAEDGMWFELPIDSDEIIVTKP